MNKEQIIKNLHNHKDKEGVTLMGISESNYDKFGLTKEFLNKEKIDPNELTEKELTLLIKMAEYAEDIFY